MPVVGRVAEVRRYPVKSMTGELLDRVAVGPQGLLGDRAWAVRDEVRGGIRGAKKIPGLLRCAARYPDPPTDARVLPAEITLPDGSRVRSDDSDAAKRVSEAVGHEVTLWPLQPAEDREHYRRGAPDHADLETELRSIFAREPDEPLPDLGALPREVLEFESPPGTYFDAFPLLLVTRASLERLREAAPGSRIDVRRFRPNFLVDGDGGDELYPELAWGGRRLRIGGMLAEATVACPRCVMITHAQEDLPRDARIMRHVVRDAGGSLGVYARVAEPGPVAVGDPVELL